MGVVLSNDKKLSWFFTVRLLNKLDANNASKWRTRLCTSNTTIQIFRYFKTFISKTKMLHRMLLQIIFYLHKKINQRMRIRKTWYEKLDRFFFQCKFSILTAGP